MIPQKKIFEEGRGRADVNQQKHTHKIQSLNLIRSHVSITTAVTVIIVSLITNIKVAIITIAITKNDYHYNNNSNNNNNNNDNNKSTNNSNNIQNNNNSINNNNNNNNNNDNNYNNNRSLFKIN